jgi:hypothetical protein
LKDDEILVKTTDKFSNLKKIKLLKYVRIGIVEEKGLLVKDLAKKDKVIWVGIKAENKIIGPEYLFCKVPHNLKDNFAIYAGVGAFIIQSIRRSGLTFGENVVIFGRGILKKIVSQVIEMFGLNNLELEYTIKKNIAIDGVIICSGEVKERNLLKKLLRNNAIIIVLTDINDDNLFNLFKEKNLRIITPEIQNFREKNIYYPKAYMRWTIREDMQLFLELLNKRRIKII